MRVNNCTGDSHVISLNFTLAKSALKPATMRWQLVQRLVQTTVIGLKSDDDPKEMALARGRDCNSNKQLLQSKHANIDNDKSYFPALISTSTCC